MCQYKHEFIATKTTLSPYSSPVKVQANVYGMFSFILFSFKMRNRHTYISELNVYFICRYEHLRLKYCMRMLHYSIFIIYIYIRILRPHDFHHQNLSELERQSICFFYNYEHGKLLDLVFFRPHRLL